MSQAMQRELHSVLDEMSSAYRAASYNDYMNADYADYAIMALSRFREILGDPTLSAEELRFRLRQLISHHRQMGEQGCWKGFVAAQMAGASNMNGLQEIKQ